jgi:hypothetical protein
MTEMTLSLPRRGLHPTGRCCQWISYGVSFRLFSCPLHVAGSYLALTERTKTTLLHSGGLHGNLNQEGTFLLHLFFVSSYQTVANTVSTPVEYILDFAPCPPAVRCFPPVMFSFGRRESIRRRRPDPLSPSPGALPVLISGATWCRVRGLIQPPRCTAVASEGTRTQRERQAASKHQLFHPALQYAVSSAQGKASSRIRHGCRTHGFARGGFYASPPASFFRFRAGYGSCSIRKRHHEHDPGMILRLHLSTSLTLTLSDLSPATPALLA